MLQHALAAAKEAVYRAGDVVLSYYQSHYEVQSKGIDNPVTTADLAANQILRDTLLHAFPQAGWLSEESADNMVRLQREAVWIIDPIDGTKEFIQGVDEFVIVVALVVQQQVAVAVTYNPVRRELFHACRGQGAFCNAQPIRVSRTAQLPGALVLASRSETSRGEWERFRDILTVRPLGSVAYKLAQVAQGACDLTFSLVPKHEWDICAGTLLVTEAGGQVTDLQGQSLRFNQPETLRAGLIATNGHLHAQVLELTQVPGGEPS
ncbi:MAG: 3'(2'),5'-bisphosphate nucleotidase CysQ [Candidatus Tectomicrobia bacterium]|uniref:3'(2'),5'-bisphosphate nucleotidase CysQ n=1 Tax=Tectimicrobiota bacterium TaxID=2528274 RepID=A0A938B1Z6_UNCTE|nr:3'(2'),5'-bisphosphate nucleotidase CysQ [Candidatus Tectomicrobia bacterium]